MLNQKTSLYQQQQLRMNPQLYQSIQLMAMPIQELKLRIQQELEANPALEVVSDDSTLSLDDVSKSDSDRDDYEYFENSSDPGFTSVVGTDPDAADNKRRFMEGALSRPESLHEHLLWQLRLQPISEEAFAIGEALIQNLDENGFHREPVESFVPPESMGIAEQMIHMIQGFDPVGTCVSDYNESLRVQAELREDEPPGTAEIIEEYLDLLDRERFAEIAKKTRRPEKEVIEILEFIRTLTPFPGRLYSVDKPTYVIPDLMVKKKEGGHVIIMNDEEIPVLDVNEFFTSVQEKEQKAQTDVRRYVRGKIKDARWFIHSIHQRNQTLLKVARAIVEFQRDFFYKGPKALVPLTLKDIASEVGVHEATVSRITTGKYVQTEYGIFELKYFFSNSISGAGSTGSRFSKEGVKQVVKEILEAESKEKHLSDQKIADLLRKRGINIARRTVAKYRNELDISSSYERR